MWWVLCNICFVKPGGPVKRQFYVTTCFHVLCNNCLGTDQHVCKKCGQKCSVIECNSKAPNVVKELFNGISESSVKKVNDAHSFQHKHRSQLINHFRTLTKKYKMAKQVIAKEESDLKILHHKYNKAKLLIQQKDEQIESLRRQIRDYKSDFSSQTSKFELPNYQDTGIDYNPVTPRNIQKNSTVFITPDSLENNTPRSLGSIQTPFHSNRVDFTPHYASRNSTLDSLFSQ